MDNSPSLKEILNIIENRRLRVLQDQNDPSWTEHFTELQSEIVSFWKMKTCWSCAERGFPINKDGIFGTCEVCGRKSIE